VNNDTVENYLKFSEKHLPLGLFAIVKSHLNLKNQKKKGFRYNSDIKQLALNIYFLEPRVYKLLQNNLSFPSIPTLKRVTTKFELMPGLNDFLFNIISFKINHFNDESKECVLCLDEMALKTSLRYNIS